jgi:hypothetical protein
LASKNCLATSYRKRQAYARSSLMGLVVGGLLLGGADGDKRTTLVCTVKPH